MRVGLKLITSIGIFLPPNGTENHPHACRSFVGLEQERGIVYRGQLTTWRHP